jgi:cathepsin D
MGYPSHGEDGVSSIFDHMMSQRMLDANIFAFYLGSSPEVTLGFYDKSRFHGELDWHSVEDKYGYAIRFDDIKVKGQNLNICDG